MDNWCTIESDPAVFSELIESWGVQNIDVEEIFSLEEDQFLNSLKPIHGFIFLFKWTNMLKKQPSLLTYDPELYFAKQVITNACATQALLSILLNCEKSIPLSGELSDLRNFGMQLDSYSRGLTIGQCQKIRETHNSFARPEPFAKMGSKPATEKDDVYHFVAFIYKNGKAYELDGLQEGPILIADNVDQNTWINAALKQINVKVKDYATEEIKFNLMVIKNSTMSIVRQKLHQINSDLAFLNKKGKEFGLNVDFENADFNIFEQNLTPSDEIVNLPIELIMSKMSQLLVEKKNLSVEVVSLEGLKKERKEENDRRKHNYLPFIFEMFKIAAENGQLDQLYMNTKSK